MKKRWRLTEKTAYAKTISTDFFYVDKKHLIVAVQIGFKLIDMVKLATEKKCLLV